MGEIQSRTPDGRYGQLTAAADFEQTLNEAKRLLDGPDTSTALALLHQLEQKYIKAVAVFDLIGDALLKQGVLEEGIRYKTLHEVLKGTFKIAMEESSRSRKTSATPFPIGTSTKIPTLPVFGKTTDVILIDSMKVGGAGTGDTTCVDDVLPVTAAMGQELLRQGHYDRAFYVFSRLLQNNPDNEELALARDKAKKAASEKKVVGVLQKWLKNIENFKDDRSEPV